MASNFETDVCEGCNEIFPESEMLLSGNGQYFCDECNEDGTMDECEGSKLDVPDNVISLVGKGTKVKKEIEDLLGSSEFDINHNGEKIYFKMTDCHGDGVHCYFFGKHEGMSEAQGVPAFMPVDDIHIELNKFELFLNKIGFKFTLRKKIKRVVPKWREAIIKRLEDRESMADLFEEFGGKLQ